MHATHCLVGCVLCLASFGAAAATSGESQDMGSSAAHAAMGSSTHNAGSTTADTTDANSSSDPANPASEQGSPLSGSGNTPSPGAVPMHRAPEHHVGWQSLLPGSIQ